MVTRLTTMMGLNSLLSVLSQTEWPSKHYTPLPNVVPVYRGSPSAEGPAIHPSEKGELLDFLASYYQGQGAVRRDLPDAADAANCARACLHRADRVTVTEYDRLHIRGSIEVQGRRSQRLTRCNRLLLLGSREGLPRLGIVRSILRVRVRKQRIDDLLDDRLLLDVDTVRLSPLPDDAREAKFQDLDVHYCIFDEAPVREVVDVASVLQQASLVPVIDSGDPNEAYRGVLAAAPSSWDGESLDDTDGAAPGPGEASTRPTQLNLLFRDWFVVHAGTLSNINLENPFSTSSD